MILSYASNPRRLWLQRQIIQVLGQKMDGDTSGSCKGPGFYALIIFNQAIVHPLATRDRSCCIRSASDVVSGKSSSDLTGLSRSVANSAQASA